MRTRIVKMTLILLSLFPSSADWSHSAENDSAQTTILDRQIEIENYVDIRSLQAGLSKGLGVPVLMEFSIDPSKNIDDAYKIARIETTKGTIKEIVGGITLGDGARFSLRIQDGVPIIYDEIKVGDVTLQYPLSGRMSVGLLSYILYVLNEKKQLADIFMIGEEPKILANGPCVEVDFKSNDKLCALLFRLGSATKTTWRIIHSNTELAHSENRKTLSIDAIFYGDPNKFMSRNGLAPVAETTFIPHPDQSAEKFGGDPGMNGLPADRVISGRRRNRAPDSATE